MAQQTAVEWLEVQLKKQGFLYDLDIEAAKQMEKEHHQETFKQSRQAKIFEEGMPPVWESFEQYYHKTFGNK